MGGELAGLLVDTTVAMWAYDLDDYSGKQSVACLEYNEAVQLESVRAANVVSM